MVFRLHAPATGLPSLEGATGWLNTEPLTPDDLRDRVVLVNFCTFTCINWLRQLPYVRAWAEKYQDHGLVVIGAHTPEFSIEHDIENVRRALEEMNVDFPIAVDNDYAVWDAFSNNAWPALYLADEHGMMRYRHYGEGRYSETEEMIQDLLGVGDELVSVEGEGIEAPADWDELGSPETYVGYGRGERFASPEGAAADGRQPYTIPDDLGLNRWALAGEWMIGRESAVVQEAGGRLAYRFHARDLHLVLAPSEAPVPFRVLIDGSPPGASHGGDIDDQGNGMLSAPKLHQLIRQSGSSRIAPSRSRFSSPGLGFIRSRSASRPSDPPNPPNSPRSSSVRQRCIRRPPEPRLA